MTMQEKVLEARAQTSGEVLETYTRVQYLYNAGVTQEPDYKRWASNLADALEALIAELQAQL